jgi:hypothetical protein
MMVGGGFHGCRLPSIVSPELRLPSGFELACVLTAGPDADTAIDGINRLMIVIRDRAANLRRSHDEASQTVQRLANS